VGALSDVLIKMLVESIYQSNTDRAVPDFFWYAWKDNPFRIIDLALYNARPKVDKTVDKLFISCLLQVKKSLFDFWCAH